jgi:hypothetical protein
MPRGAAVRALPEARLTDLHAAAPVGRRSIVPFRPDSGRRGRNENRSTPRPKSASFSDQQALKEVVPAGGRALLVRFVD